MNKAPLLLLVMLYACSPKVLVNEHANNMTFPATGPDQSFALIEYQDTAKPADEKIIAEIHIKDNGLSINCDYETVKRMAEEKARQLGGNCLVITQHIEPNNLTSSCHRIKARVSKISNPEQFEKHIRWHQNRPLKIENFRGSTDKRPFQAATFTSIRYFATSNPGSGKAKIVAESLFDCGLSYFKTSESDSSVLAHEQLHFDIAEIYARKFRKRIKEEALNYKEFLNKHNNLISGIFQELSVKQDEYDSEVYANASLQSKWSQWVQEELKRLEAYQEQAIELPLK